jgi:hypothetical protein
MEPIISEKQINKRVPKFLVRSFCSFSAFLNPVISSSSSTHKPCKNYKTRENTRTQMREKHEKQLPAGKATVIRSDHKQFQ